MKILGETESREIGEDYDAGASLQDLSTSYHHGLPVIRRTLIGLGKDIRGRLDWIKAKPEGWRKPREPKIVRPCRECTVILAKHPPAERSEYELCKDGCFLRKPIQVRREYVEPTIVYED